MLDKPKQLYKVWCKKKVSKYKKNVSKIQKKKWLCLFNTKRKNLGSQEQCAPSVGMFLKSNEILGIKEAGGIVFGLPRDIVNGKDTHSSEQVDLSKCNYLLPEGNIDATTKALYKIIAENKIHPFRSKVG